MCKEYNEIQHTGFNNLNEYQLSLLYLSDCIWYGYNKSYAEWVKVKETTYPIGKVTTSAGCKFYQSVLDKFRPHSKLCYKLLNAY